MLSNIRNAQRPKNGPLEGRSRAFCPKLDELQRAIADFLAAWNAAPAPFVWTASVEAILEEIVRARQRLEQIEPGSTLPKRRSSTPIIRRAQP